MQRDMDATAVGDRGNISVYTGAKSWGGRVYVSTAPAGNDT